MKLALVTGWLACTAVAVWAAPAPAHLKAPADDTLMALDARRTDGACIRLSRSTTPCPVARQDANPMPSTPSETPASSTTGSLSSSKTTFNSPTDPSQSTHSFIMTLSSAAHGTEAEANADSNYSPANNQLRTIGIIGGLLAGIALIAIICIILILLRNYRRRGSIAPSSIRSRTASSTRQHRPQFLTRQVGDPIMRPPALRINTGDVMATVSRDLTTTGTLGHHGGLHPFPVSGHDSASSRTTSFGHHSASTGPSSLPRRPPQIPSLGLSQPRPLLRSFGSLFSHNASAGHLSVIAREEHPQPSVPAPPSTTGSKTMAATEDADRTEQTDRTEDTGRTETTHTTHTEETGTMPVEQSHESSPKPA